MINISGFKFLINNRLKLRRIIELTYPLKRGYFISTKNHRKRGEDVLSINVNLHILIVRLFTYEFYRMRKKYSILAFFLLITGLVHAQSAKRDSLLGLLSAAKEDPATVKLYIEIGEQYESLEPLIAKNYYRKAEELSKKINDRKGLIKSFTYYANACSILGERDSIRWYGQKALDIARQSKDTFNIGIGLFNIGMSYGYEADYEMAIKYCLEGLKILEGKSYNTIEVQINDKLQVLYMQMSQYDKAILFGEKAVQQSRELKMPVFLGPSLSNLAMSYSGKKMPEKAKVLLEEALKISKQLEDINMEASVLLNLADISLLTGDYAMLKVHSERSLLLYRQLGALNGEANSLRALGIYYLQKKEFSKAQENAEKSLTIAKENNYKAEYASGLKVLSSIAYAAGDMQAGEKYNRESETILSEMIEDVLSQKSANLEKIYETQKKETQINQLEAEKKLNQLSIRQKNILNYILIGAAATLLIISLLSYRNYKQKQKLQQVRISELETEKQLTATEAVLKGEEQERTRLAKDLHDGLGGMLSGIKHSFGNMKQNLIMTPDNREAFERSMDMLDSSIKEMRRVAHNMMPENLLKFGLEIALRDFCIDISTNTSLQVNYQSVGLADVQLEQSKSISIYRIVQELIHNSLKHASAQTALVQISKTDEQIVVEVEDDGVGFNINELKQVKGIGWNNIQSRVDFLKGKLDVQSAPGKGTSIHIEFETE
jgi:two-component system NarL family sensor kinase